MTILSNQASTVATERRKRQSPCQKYRYMSASTHHEIRSQRLSLVRLLRALVDTHNHGVVALKGLECQLLLWLDAHFPQLGDFLCETGFGRSGRVDTVGLDGYDDAAADFEE